MKRDKKERMLELFMEEGMKHVIGNHPMVIDDFSVNCKKDKKYPRWVYPDVDSAIKAMEEKGEGFTISAGFNGGHTDGATTSTSDFGVHLDNEFWEDA